ncbi:hypothetical protein [Streptomyces sp. NPDC051921]|uniref:hypothetical protein n=1 Tax=Streptomyces sp. NPDC051921 TaxID=3155806 RepID=UPI00343CC276
MVSVTGWYRAATTGQHAGFESRLEQDRLLLMDFDPKVTGIASQPFSRAGAEGAAQRAARGVPSDSG